jgi:hypothetical protein
MGCSSVDLLMLMIDVAASAPASTLAATAGGVQPVILCFQLTSQLPLQQLVVLADICSTNLGPVLRTCLHITTAPQDVMYT